MMNRLIETEHLAAVVKDVTGHNIHTKTRDRRVVETRAIYYYLCRKYTNYTMSEISRTVGKNHATVVHGLRVMENWMNLYPDFKKQVEACDLRVKYIYRVLEDESQTVEEALTNLFTLEEENKKLIQANVELLSRIQDMEEEKKSQDRYLTKAGYKESMSRLGMKYNTK